MHLAHNMRRCTCYTTYALLYLDHKHNATYARMCTTYTSQQMTMCMCTCALTHCFDCRTSPDRANEVVRRALVKVKPILPMLVSAVFTEVLQSTAFIQFS